MCPDQLASLVDVLKDVILMGLGVVIALWYERIGDPRVSIELEPCFDRPEGSFGRVRSLRLRARNRPRRAWLVSRRTAVSCHGNIQFLDVNRNPLCSPMPIRWADSPQPVRTEVINAQRVGLPEPNLVRLSRYIDIPPDESELLDLAIRIHGERDAYGWTTESYFHNWRHPDYCLPHGDCLALVTLTTGDDVVRMEARIRNAQEFDMFDVIEIRPARCEGRCIA